ncbi:TANK-binding kinase 1-binding protein 1 isoform X1 [Orcinus orca]|uniref:TANK-binding kinase 1-binding protein 1 isoform X1 n=2 Tax=Orcinus orca TaxID=9733 RepID=UPI0014422EF3|nr:TANK-binding kinase 1-binding protein 1 isoform X1 [Orcinus orca]
MGLGGGCETRGQDQAASQLAAGLLRPGQGVLGTSSGPPSPPLLVAPALPGGPGRAVAQALAMESMFEDDISILTQEALGPSEVWLDAPGDPSLGGDMCSASHFALITAYGDIKERLGGLERENATLRRRLKVYEIKYPLINDFGEEHGFSLYEIKDGSLLEVEKVSLQQRLNQFQHELQKNKEQEEQLGEMIQAYEKLCVEKSDLETELGEMRALVETHLRQICGLEQQLRQQQGLRDAAFPSLSPPPAPAPPCADLDLHYLALRGGSGLSHGWPGPTPSMSELERRQLEEALEAAQGEARGAQLREEQLQAECERLQGELKQLQETRAQDLASNQSERDMAWVKRVGDDQSDLRSRFPCCSVSPASGGRCPGGQIAPEEEPLRVTRRPKAIMKEEGEFGAGLHGADRGAGPASGVEFPAGEDPEDSAAGAGSEWRPEALAAVAAPLPGPPVSLALPAGPSGAPLSPVPVPRPPAPLSRAPLPFAPAAPLAGLALLPVARPAAPLAGAAAMPVPQPAVPLPRASRLPGPAAPAPTTPAARGEDTGRASLRQAAQPPREGRLPGPAQLLGDGGGRGLRGRLPALAAGRGGHAAQAAGLRQRALRPRPAPQPTARLRGHPPALREAAVGGGGVGRARQPAQPAQPGGWRHPLRLVLRWLPHPGVARRHSLHPRRARAVLAVHQPADGDSGL